MPNKLALVYISHQLEPWNISEAQVARLAKNFSHYNFIRVDNEADFLKHLPEAVLVFCWKFEEEWYRQAECLQYVFTPAAGRDWVKPDPSGKVQSIHGHFHGKIMAESLLALVLYFSRRLGETVQAQRQHNWQRGLYATTHSLSQQRVLIIGFGAIGREFARLLKPFGCYITGVKRDLSGHYFIDEVISFADMDEALSQADHVVFILPGEKDAEEIFTRRHFELMKPSAYLYNIGRGNCYREEDLIEALREKRIAGAGLDVYTQEPLPPDSPLWDLPNTVIIPHATALALEYLDYYTQEIVNDWGGIL